MRTVLLGWLLLAGVGKASDLTDTELLARVRAQMTENLHQLPNYTCRQTVERSAKEPRSNRFVVEDLLRLDVAYLQNRELFAWPGAPFETEDIRALVPRGTVGLADFGPIIRALFLTNGPAFEMAGKSVVDGRAEVEFAFQVPRERSTLHIGRNDSVEVVPYRGRLVADAKTFDVISLVVEADDVPPELEISRVRDAIEYARFRIHGADFVLPQTAVLETVEPIGLVHRNRTTFADCREYLGESTVTFVEPGTERQPGAREAPEPGLPPGTALEFRTTEPVKSGVTALGDRISGKVTKEIAGRVRIPKGAELTLRVTRMETYASLQIVGLQLLSVTVGGRQYTVHAALEGAGDASIKASPRNAKFRIVTRPEIYQLPDLRSGEGIFAFQSGRLFLPAGLPMSWRTTGEP